VIHGGAGNDGADTTHTATRLPYAFRVRALSIHESCTTAMNRSRSHNRVTKRGRFMREG
jgi:hypothetical protein